VLEVLAQLRQIAKAMPRHKVRECPTKLVGLSLQKHPSLSRSSHCVA